jgi:hypothetical protein
MSFRNTIPLLILLFPGLPKAQSAAPDEKAFPGEEAVMLNNSRHYTISIRNNQPFVESEENQEIQYLSTHAAVYMSQYGFFHSDFQQVVGYEAYTLTADKRKLKVNNFKTNNYKDGSVFYDDVKQTSFDFPAVGPGAVGHLSVFRVHKEAHLLSPFFFSSRIPVLNSELKITFPESMSVKYVLQGNDTSKISVAKESRRGIANFTFRSVNNPAEKKYEDAPDNAWYGNQVIFYIEKYKADNGLTVPFLSTPGDLYQFNYGFVKNINEKTDTALKRIVSTLTGKASSDEEKARNIYKWVQQNIKYVAFEEGMEGFVPRDASLVCGRRFGDCKDMSSLLTVMMKTAGIPAYYTWIGTRDLPYRFSRLPLPLVSNHMICTILLNGKYIFLDGTHPTCIFGVPPGGIQGKEAMVALNEKEYKILEIPVTNRENNSLLDSTFLELTTGSLRGIITEHYTGYFAMDTYARIRYLDEDNLLQRWRDILSRGSNKFRLDSLTFHKDPDFGEIGIGAGFSLPDYAKKIGSDWYINLNLFKFFEHQEIDYPKRTTPIAFDFKFTKKYVTELKIPEGYRVSYLPPSKSFHNDTWGFDLRYEQHAGSIVLTQEFSNNFLLLEPGQFAAWNKVLEYLFPTYKETISLSKITDQ